MTDVNTEPAAILDASPPTVHELVTERNSCVSIT
ncbi:hypothetical protein SUDANB6_05335 [Streptomyces sp. enrichment culture]